MAETGVDRLLSGLRARFVPVLTLAFVVVVALGLEPLYREYPSEAPPGPTYKLAQEAAKAGARSYSYPLASGILATVRGVYGIQDGTLSGLPSIKKEIRWDNLIALTFGFILTLIFGSYLKEQANLGIASGAEAPSSPLAEIGDEFLRVTRTMRLDADRQFLQARLMLVTGILVAIAGVVIFATVLDFEVVRRDSDSIPRRFIFESAFDRMPLEELAKNASVDAAKLNYILEYNQKVLTGQVAPGNLGFFSYALPAARSFALFLALEAIAWFLLRQYRFAIGDFKQLYAMYTRRESFYLAWQISQTPDASESGMPVAVLAALLQPEQSGKLSKDETTEVLEERKLVEENPVTALLTAAINNWRSK